MVHAYSYDTYSTLDALFALHQDQVPSNNGTASVQTGPITRALEGHTWDIPCNARADQLVLADPP